jgi:Tfp pilus assembly protein PilF
MPEQAPHELFSDVSWAMARGLPKRDLVAMLNKLATTAADGSDEQMFAKLELASLIVQEEPFRAARLALDVTHACVSDRAFGILGVAHSLLGSFGAARRAHERAVQLAPDCAAHRHNLGHLLDVAFERPREALRHLRAAAKLSSSDPAIASSLAHALVRAGHRAKARAILVSELSWDAEEAEATLTSWANAGR